MNCSSHEQELCQILVQNSSVINNKLNVTVVLNSAVLQKKFQKKDDWQTCLGSSLLLFYIHGKQLWSCLDGKLT